MSDSFLSDEEEESSGEGDVVDAEFEEVDSNTATSGGLIEPVTDDLQEIAKTYDAFEEVKSELLDPNADMETIGGNPFITKSGWRKIATAFNISVETTEENRSQQNGIVQWRVKAKAIAPNNVSATGIGMAASNESNFMDFLTKDLDQTSVEVAENYGEDVDDVLVVDDCYRALKDPKEVDEHDIFATAATRAKNRAISDLVGGGEVSAEELDADAFIS